MNKTVKFTFQSVEAVDNWLAELRKQGNWNVRKRREHENSNAGRQKQKRPNSEFSFLFFFVANCGNLTERRKTNVSGRDSDASGLRDPSSDAFTGTLDDLDDLDTNQ